jgi:hypothetical protein
VENNHKENTVVKVINTVVSIILIGIGSYHFTRPAQAWRSGTMEFLCAALLLTSAYRWSQKKAMVVNLVVGLGIGALGIRHLAIGGGWASGSTEVFFAILLVTVAMIVHRRSG